MGLFRSEYERQARYRLSDLKEPLMKRLKFGLREFVPDDYDKLTIALKIECEPKNDCFHDHYYMSEEQFKQLPAAAQKFNVERKHNSGDTGVSNRSDTR